MFYSQFGEDRSLRDFSDSIEAFALKWARTMGCLAATLFSSNSKAENCVLIEPNPLSCQKLRENRSSLIFECAVSDAPGDVTLHVVEGPAGADGMSTISRDARDHARFLELGFSSVTCQVRCTTLDTVLHDSKVTGPIEFISIDVEGIELPVLRGLSWRDGNRASCSSKTTRVVATAPSRTILRARGFRRFDRTGVNDWYARVEDEELVNAASRLKAAGLSALVPLSRRLRGLSSNRVARAIARRIPGAALLYKKLPF